MSEDQLQLMVERSNALRDTLRAGGYERGDGVSGEGIKLVSKLARKNGLRDWMHTRDVADYDALIRAVRAHLLAAGVNLPPPPCPFKVGDLANVANFWIYKITAQKERTSSMGYTDYPLYGILAGLRIKSLLYGERLINISFEPRAKENLIPMWYLAAPWDGAGVVFGTPQAGELKNILREIAGIRARKFQAKRYSLSITAEIQELIDQEHELIARATTLLSNDQEEQSLPGTRSATKKDSE